MPAREFHLALHASAPTIEIGPEPTARPRPSSVVAHGRGQTRQTQRRHRSRDRSLGCRGDPPGACGRGHRGRPASDRSLRSPPAARLPELALARLDTWIVTHEDLRELPRVRTLVRSSDRCLPVVSGDRHRSSMLTALKVSLRLCKAANSVPLRRGAYRVPNATRDAKPAMFGAAERPVLGLDRRPGDRDGAVAAEALVSRRCLLRRVARPEPAQDRAISSRIVGHGWAAGRLPPTDERIDVVGPVDDLAEVFSRVRLTVAPLRFGAGIKGKVLESFAAGIPCVVSPVAAEGLMLPAPLPDLVADGVEAMARAILRFHNDASANQSAQAAALAMIARVVEAMAGVLPGHRRRIGPG